MSPSRPRPGSTIALPEVALDSNAGGRPVVGQRRSAWLKDGGDTADDPLTDPLGANFDHRHAAVAWNQAEWVRRSAGRTCGGRGDAPPQGVGEKSLKSGPLIVVLKGTGGRSRTWIDAIGSATRA